MSRVLYGAGNPGVSALDFHTIHCGIDHVAKSLLYLLILCSWHAI